VWILQGKTGSGNKREECQGGSIGMRVVIDAMGAERGVSVVIQGTMEALRENSQIEPIMVGNENEIRKRIKELSLKEDPFRIVHASQTVEMEELPLTVLKKGKTSIGVALDLVKEGEAEALVSTGNTGAVMAASLFKLGRLKGIKRPCLAVVLPTSTGEKVILMDVGANVDCKPYHLFQFALMGSIYAYKIFRKREPRIGLLNIGTENNKGNALTLQTFRLLEDSSLNFIGNIEGRDITRGKAEVIVCDGFVGNVLLKFAEGFAETTLNTVDREINKRLPLIGRLLLKSSLKKIKKSLDYAEYGGVPLLGVKGVCVVAHGASSDKAIKNAILNSIEYAQMKINEEIEKVISRVEGGGIEKGKDSGGRVLYSRKDSYKC